MDGRDLFPETVVRVVPGFRSLTWNGSTGSVSFLVGLAGNITTWPAQPVAVRPGQTVDLSALPQDAIGIACTFSPVLPWTPLDVHIFFQDSGGISRPVTLTWSDGQDVPPYLDLRTGRLARDIGGNDARAGPLVLNGPDGSLTVLPFPIDNTGAAFKASNQYP
jgi:hypothetical protein